jgi:hypothetical protein
VGEEDLDLARAYRPTRGMSVRFLQDQGWPGQCARFMLLGWIELDERAVSVGMGQNSSP